MQNAVANYKSLEEKHFHNLNNLKEAEDRASIKTSKCARLEEETAQLKEKVKLLEAECIQSIGKGWEDGQSEVIGENFKRYLMEVFEMGGKQLYEKPMLLILSSSTSERAFISLTPRPD